MSIKNVKIENFTVFEKIDIGFADGINVLIGENATGKTHLMKVMYVSDLKMRQNKKVEMDDYFNDSTIPHKHQINPLDSNGQYTLVDNEPEITLFNLDRTQNISTVRDKTSNVVFIPAKDMLSHSKGLLEMAKKYSNDMPFDKSLLDIIEKAKQWKVDIVPEIGKNVLTKLEHLIGGKVIIENDTFYIKNTEGYMTEFSMEAEGIKKIAILWQLIMNENITKDSILFWDEPEANINPKLIKDVVEILLELSRNGVQIFVATHNYVFAKYVEVLMKDTDDVSFHALYKTENEGVKCETNKNFRDLQHNSIMTTLDNLIEQVFDLDLGD